MEAIRLRLHAADAIVTRLESAKESERTAAEAQGKAACNAVGAFNIAGVVGIPRPDGPEIWVGAASVNSRPPVVGFGVLPDPWKIAMKIFSCGGSPFHNCSRVSRCNRSLFVCCHLPPKAWSSRDLMPTSLSMVILGMAPGGARHQRGISGCTGSSRSNAVRSNAYDVKPRHEPPNAVLSPLVDVCVPTALPSQTPRRLVAPAYRHAGVRRFGARWASHPRSIQPAPKSPVGR